ncbi:MAG: 3'-5' exonuclease, partial [Aureliella sp.]
PVRDRAPREAFLVLAALQRDTDRLKGSDSVTLMTLHAAKGLEFPVVYIIAVEENILPHQRSKDDPHAIEEERRLLFVGITRAKDQLQLSYARRRSFRDAETPGIPSSFLMELPRGEMTWLDLSEPDPYSFDHDPGDAIDEYSQLAGRWSDEDFNQLPDVDDVHSQIDADDSCQLPPEELQRHMLGKFKGRLMTASQLADERPRAMFSEAAFSAGRVVSHPQYGSGRIIAASGRGPKRSVTVEFFSSGEQRDFRLSHAQLTIEEG